MQKAIGFFRNFPLEKWPLQGSSEEKLTFYLYRNRLVSSSPKRLTRGEVFYE